MSRVVLTLLLRLPAPYDPRSKQARAGDSVVEAAMRLEWRKLRSAKWQTSIPVRLALTRSVQLWVTHVYWRSFPLALGSVCVYDYRARERRAPKFYLPVFGYEQRAATWHEVPSGEKKAPGLGHPNRSTLIKHVHGSVHATLTLGRTNCSNNNGMIAD